MSLLPRRGPGRHEQPAEVAVHPGWTLTPTAVTEPTAPAEKPTVTAVPASRWTSHPPLPAQPVPAEPVVAPAPAAPAAPVAPVTAVAAPVQPPPVAERQPHAAPVPAVEPPPSPSRSWNQDWAAVAATPAPADAPVTLHTAAVAAIDAIFGTRSAAPPAWTAAPAGLQQQPHPAPLPPQVLGPVAPAIPATPAPSAPVPSVPAQPVEQPRPSFTDLDRPLTSADRLAETPLAAEVARATSAQVTVGPPLAVVPRTAAPSVPAPTTPPTRPALSSPAAQQAVEHAIRTAPTMPPPRRSTVRLGFADASVIDLRPEDPIAKALHTVADALLSRDRS